jgi:hypothetical protein
MLPAMALRAHACNKAKKPATTKEKKPTSKRPAAIKNIATAKISN